jgi:adenylate cyclase
VNLAARLEKITGRLGRTVVASEMFANVCRRDWHELGEFPIAGFSKAQRVYGLTEETPVVMA